ncbi:MAG: DUF1254 domain-containing protein [Burkholderiales bacterium]|nr:DUF1254 domain-containing protein [Burkholderiales bacterium]
MSRKVQIVQAAGAAATALVLAGATAAEARPLAADEAREIAIEAYVYAYPAVITELTRRVNIARPGAAMNRFAHRSAFPEASFTDVVRPNADTLYSVLWFDLSAEPLAIRVPASGGRYWLLQMLDQWSDTFAAPGSRTTGDAEQLIVLAGPGWNGALPQGATLVRSPTASGWIIGRTQTNGAADYAAVHRFQAGMSAVPLSRFGQGWTPPAPRIDPAWDLKTPPVELIEKLDAQQYFGLFAELTKTNPPHANDYPVLHRMARLGLRPGQPFVLADLPAPARQAFEGAAAAALPQIKGRMQTMGVRKDGWRTNLTAIGTYGTDYRARAAIAFAGLGANPVEDAVYPSAFGDADGQPLQSDRRYVLHFDKAQIPPVRAFWSLTMYDQRQLFAANAIDRYAIGDRDALKFNADGSLDLYIQRESPGDSMASNWLPTPASGPFTMNLRLYWPRPEVLDGQWWPPALKRAD